MRMLLVLALVLVTGGCAAGPGSSGEASCADVATYAGHRYHGYGELQRWPATSGSAGSATRLGCDDGNGATRDGPMEVTELRAVPLDRAFLSHGQVYVRDDLAFPAAARAWFEPTRCAETAPFALTGRWLGVESAGRARFDGDLRPPYRLTAWVTQGPRTYVDTRVTVHADRRTDPSLGPDDVKGSLGRGGWVTAQVHCAGGRFVADGLTTS